MRHTEPGSQNLGTPLLVDAVIEWKRAVAPVSGILQNGFLPEGNRILVELNPLHEKPPGWEGSSLWVDLKSIKQDNLVLRSELWELPQGDAKDYALRNFLFSLCDWIRAKCVRVELLTGASGGEPQVELVFWLEIPGETVLDYLQALRAARGSASARRMSYSQPGDLLFQRSLTERQRSQVAQGAAHLSQWFNGDLVWSVFKWSGNSLYHIVEFSVDRKYEKNLVRSLGLTAR